MTKSQSSDASLRSYSAEKGSTVVLPSDFQSVRPDSPLVIGTPGPFPSHAPAPTPALIHVRPLNVLIACEESQAECAAFRKLGHNAYSCDIEVHRKGGVPGWHIHGDVTPFLDGKTSFDTMDGVHHEVSQWDLIVAHPPCTFLCNVSSVHMVKDGRLQWPRFRQMILARRFFMKCLAAKATYVAVENPLPMTRARLPKPSCFIQPSWFGVKYTKKTLYWLRNLPPLMAEVEYPNPRQFVMATSGKYRSRTFPQVARAMARQWSEFILLDLFYRGNLP